MDFLGTILGTLTLVCAFFPELAGDWIASIKVAYQNRIREAEETDDEA